MDNSIEILGDWQRQSPNERAEQVSASSDKPNASSENSPAVTGDHSFKNVRNSFAERFVVAGFSGIEGKGRIYRRQKSGRFSD